MQQDIYLNHAGTSWPKPAVVVEAVNASICRSPLRWGDFFERAHHAIAAFFGVSQVENLLLTPGCTSSLAVALGDINLGERKRILTSEWEHHALHRPLLKLVESGASLKYVPPCSDSPLDLNRLEGELAKGDVGLVAITASANVTGDVLPYETAIALAHKHNTQVLIDAAQVVGWLDLNLDELGADMVAFGGHKGLQGPWGIGGLYIGENARMTSRNASRQSIPTNTNTRPGYCDAGSVDQVALAGLHAAVEWLSNIDRPQRLTAARAQINRIESTLEQLGARCYHLLDASQRMPTVAFSVGGRSSSDLSAALKERGISVGSGLQCAPSAHHTLNTEQEGLIRISLGINQDEGDVEIAIALLCEILNSSNA